MKLKYAWLGLLGAFILGCGNAQEAKADVGKELVATWNLSALSENGNAIDVKAGEEVASLTFGADQQFSGNAGCNQIFGTYGLESGKLAFGGNAGMTRKMCSPQSMAIEDTLTKLLGTASSVQISGNTMTLQSGNIKAVFSK